MHKAQFRLLFKENNIIIFLYDLMLHTLINKILHANIMTPNFTIWVYREYDSKYVGMGGVRRKYSILTHKSTPYHALKNDLMLYNII